MVDASVRQQYLNKMYDDLDANMSTFYVEQKDTHPRAINVLMVEDNIADIEVLKNRLDDLKIPNNLISLDSSDSAIKYLNREKPYRDMPIPDAVFIDMCSKTIDGYEVLEFLAEDVVLQKLPVFTAFNNPKRLEDFLSPKLNYFFKVLKPLKKKSLLENFRQLTGVYQFLSPTLKLTNG